MDGRTTTTKKKKSAAAAAAHPPWVVIDRIPRLADLTARRHGGEAHDLTLDFDHPPRPSMCNLQRTLFKGVRPELQITATCHTGSFLVSATEIGRDQHQAGATAAPHERQRFLFCDGTAGTTPFLPIAPVALRRANVGLLANASGHHVVAALHETEGAADATVYLCDPYNDKSWNQVAVTYPPGVHRPWNATSVICHRTTVYCVDPALGILCYDPFAENSKLLYVPHPPGSHAHATSEGSRHVQLSREKIRCVQLEGAREHTIIKTWTLCDDSSGRQFHWKPGFEIPVSQLREDELMSRIATKVARISFIDPNKATSVFLSLEQFIFEVDLVLGNTVVHKRFAQQAGVVAVKFNVMPWSLILAQARLLPASSELRATVSTHGNGPRPSMLILDPGMPKPYRHNICYVSAVDSKCGSLLIYEQHERSANRKTWTFDGYIILHSDDTIRRLPTLPGMAKWHHNNAGIILNPSTNSTFVGLLDLSRHILNFWISENPNTWKSVSVSNPDIPSGYTWTGYGAHALDDSMYWVDLRIGFLTCKPFTESRSELKFISLPDESVLHEDKDVSISPNRVRCVNASLGSIRFVEMNSVNGFAKLWTYAHDAPGWTLEYTVQFNAVNLKNISPGFVHPWDMSVVYFLDGKKAFTIDSDEKTHEHSVFKLPKPIDGYRSSLVHLFTLPIQSLKHFPAYPAPAEV